VFLDRQDELKATTNIRGIHPVNGHNIYYIGGRRQQLLSLGLAIYTATIMMI